MTGRIGCVPVFYKGELRCGIKWRKGEPEYAPVTKAVSINVGKYVLFTRVKK